MDILAKVKRIELKTTKLVEELLAGAWRSAFKGSGIEFEEVREYVPGDDVRSIDLNVTARMGRPFIKIFREERDLTVMLLVDVSASTRFGSKGGNKEELIAEIAASLAFSAIRNQDRVGLLLFSEEVELYLPPAKGKQHILRVIREILAFQPKKKGTNIRAALRFLSGVRKKRALCFLLSDFLVAEPFMRELSVSAKKHDFVLMEVSDPLEKKLESNAYLTFGDLESGERFAVPPSKENVLSPKEFVNEKEVRKRGAEWIRFSTDTSYAEALQAFFAFRGHRR